MSYIVYKTTNLINNKIYIGVHHQEDEQFDGYLGSGHILLKAIKKNGKENFVRETLFTLSTFEDACNKEREIVSEEFVAREDTYNMTIGGSVPPSHKGRTKTLEHRLKIGAAQKGKFVSEETKQKIREKRKFQIMAPRSEETRQKMRINKLGTKHSEEVKRKMSENHWDTSGKNNPMYGRIGKNNPRYGLKVSQDIRNKQSVAALALQYVITCPHCNKIGKRSGMLKWHFANCRSK